MKLKFVLNSKRQKLDRDWSELPYDVMANILYRVGVYNILENAQKVCSSWHKICKDPAMWRVINMNTMFDGKIRMYGRSGMVMPMLRKMCKHAVDRSQGQLLDITIRGRAANEELLYYIADRSSQLRRLEIAYCFYKEPKMLAKCLEKFPLLEELSLYRIYFSSEITEIARRCCPKLTTLKINGEMSWRGYDGVAFSIGKNLPELRHLELIGNHMSNRGLQAIVDGCRHLELLDLRQCCSLKLNGEFGKKCLEKIKCVKLPMESHEGCPYIGGHGH